MTGFALDSSALVAWITQENRRWRGIDALLNQSGADPVLPTPALTETIVVARRKGNTTSPQQLHTVFLANGIRLEPPSEPDDLIRAAVLLEASQAAPGVVDAKTGVQLVLSLLVHICSSFCGENGVPLPRTKNETESIIG